MATTAETQADKNVMMTHNAQPIDSHEARPIDEKMAHEPQPDDKKLTQEAKPNDEKMTHQAQPNDVKTTHEAQPKGEMINPEVQPKYEKMSPESENNDEGIPDPHPHDLVMNPEAQPHEAIMNPETQPHDADLNLETRCHDAVVNPETQPFEAVMNPETQPFDNVVNPEAHAVMNPETQPLEPDMTSETQHQDAVITSENQHQDAVTTSENQHQDAVMTSEIQNQDAVMTSETQHVDAVTTSETQHVDAVTASETQHVDAVMTSETQHVDAVTAAETQHVDAVTAAETQHVDAVTASETQHQDAVMASETPDAVMATETPDAVMATETQHPDAVMATETQHQDGFTTSETQHQDGFTTSETQHQDGFTTSETQHQDAVMTSETHHQDAVMTSEIQHHDEMMMPETQHHDVMMSPETQQHDVMTPDTQLHDLWMTQETQPHVGMMTLETQLTNELAESDQPNDALAIHETLPGNEFAVPETQPNNAFAARETPANNAFAAIETQPNNALAIVNRQPNNEVTSPETQPNKRRKKKSIVWEHFTIENVSAGCRRACCKQCKQSFAYSTGSKVAGTSHLKRHIAKGTCTALLRNQNNNQLTPYTPRAGGSDPPKRRYRSPSLPYISFDQDRCRHEIARMIIMHDYPLHMVEHPGFITFVQNLQPRFDKVSFNTVQGDCVATYLREKQSLMKFFEGIPGRFCLTLDLWTSSRTLGYVFITGHFVDTEWKLQRRILNVVMEPYPESDSAFSHAVAACISDWSLEGRVFSLTFSHPLTEAGFEYLRPLLCIRNPLILNGQLLVGNCIAHTLSIMAKDVLAAGQEIVKKIRDSVKYVKTSESHEEKFLELKQQLQVPSEKSISVDDQTKWNTTYHMLVAASELKEVFSCLDTSDPDYKEAPSMEDWRLVETLCAFLKPLFDAANILTTTTSPTAITFFHEAWKILTDLTRSVTSEDPVVSSINKAMLEKIDKYWKDCCLVLAIAVVMDPRFKMKLVEFSFTKIYGEDAPTHVKIVDDGIHELFREYVALPLPLTPTYEEGNAGTNMKTDESRGGADNGLADFDMYIMETTGQHLKSELDQYLDESLLPRVHDFDVLGWWKLNKMKYPTLSKMARDILSIPVCSVGNDSIFDTASKEIDQYRSTLRPETVEALVCAKDWFQYGSSEASNAPVKMEL